MKKILSKIRLLIGLVSKGSWSLFAITFLVALLSGSTTLPFADETATTAFVTLMAGILSTLGIRKLGNIVGMSLTDGDTPGILGTFVAVTLMLMIS